MDYVLKQFDEPLVKFSATTDTSDPEIQILWTNEEKAALLPLGLTLTPDGSSRVGGPPPKPKKPAHHPNHPPM